MFFRIRIKNFGQLNFKWDMLDFFSERYKLVPTIRIGKLRITWRKFVDYSNKDNSHVTLEQTEIR